MVDAWVPRRGDMVWLQFHPQAGHEQSGKRPALVISPMMYNQKTGLVLACPVTSKVKGYPFEVALPSSISVKGVILSDQIKSMDWRVRNAEYVCKVPDSVVKEVLDKLELLLFS